ncbi:MAG: elongation factor G [Candidatus Acetothermia bacterium]|jgi:elongation factor G|nr:elongation factor G [Candidatus Acetothermia bacterium]
MRQAYSVCFVGHSGSGKTALAEAIVRTAGVQGEVAFDRTPEEKNRGLSIDLSVGSCTWKDKKLNLIVSPGLGEFVEEIYKGLDAADLAVVVVNAEKPVEVVTEQAWAIRQRMNRPAVVFVNMLDKPHVDPKKVLDELRHNLDGKFCALQLPIRDGDKFLGLVDLLTGQPTAFSGKGGVPDLADQAGSLRTELIEEIATFDDALLEKVLADEPLSRDEALSAMRAGVGQGRLIPVLWGSVQTGQGVKELVDTVLTLVPENTDGAAARLRVFSLAIDPYLGRLGYAKVLAGAVREGDTLFNLATKDKLQVRDVYGFSGTKLEKTGQAGAGDIVALGKLEGLTLGATLSAAPDGELEPPIPFPKPVFTRAVAPKSQADEEKMSMVLRDLVAIKATLSYQRDPVTKEALVSGMGDVQLDVLAERLRTRYGVEVQFRVPKIPYRETIRKTSTAQYRHKKQTGGHGQFGEVHLRIEPLPRGSGFEFADETKGGVIPQQFIPGVEKGVREAMEEGVLAGFPVVDVKAAVFYGMYHEVDSSELSFKIAARTAFKLAVEKAEPALLEPVMLLAVTTPDAFTGDIISDLTSRRGRILGMESAAGRTVIRAEIPMAETLSYALDLKSLTQGRATFQMEFLRYDYVPAQLQERILAQLKAKADEG